MAVEATHPTIFPQEILLNRGRGNLVDVNGHMHMYGNSMTYGMIPGALSGTTTATETLIPMCVAAVDDCFPIKDAVKSSESGLTYVGRKRSRDDDINNYSLLASRVTHYSPCFQNLQNNELFYQGKTSFLNQQQEQLEMDCLISQHTQKMRMEMEEKRRNNSRRIITAVEEIISKKLAAKDEEIEKINKFNYFLQERVQSLCVENQIWRQLAQSNEATANALRINLEQVLALTNIQDDQQRHTGGTTAAADDDAESCCGSSSYPPAGGNGGGRGDNNIGGGNRRCVNCGKEEASLLFLPCRHLCVCYACGPVLDRCPLCNTAKNGCIHVIL